MDFGKIRPVSFTRPAATAGTPAGLTRRQLARRTAMLAEASDLLPHALPAPGESFHGLMTGRYDLMALLVVILDRVPSPCRHLRVATLSFNGRNVYDLRTVLESRRVERVTLLASKSFREHNRSEYDQARVTLAEHPGCRLAAARSHAKVCCLDFENGLRLVTEGSANLRTNSNAEQIAIFHDTELHDFHSQWIDEAIERHAGEASN